MSAQARAGAGLCLVASLIAGQAFAAPPGIVYGPQSPVAAIPALSRYGISPKEVLQAAKRRPSASIEHELMAAAKRQSEATSRMFTSRRRLMGLLSMLPGGSLRGGAPARTPRTPRAAVRGVRAGTGWVYYFVSTSMPMPLLRAYARDSVWTGGALVFRGLPPGHNLAWFLHHVAAPLLANHKAVPTIVIDPRMFRAFGVDVVPTTVYSLTNPGTLCAGSRATGLTLLRASPAKAECPRAKSTRYWKVEGAVSGIWALRAFADEGAPGTGPLLKLARIRGRGRRQRIDGIGADSYATLPGPSQVIGLVRALRTQASKSIRWQDTFGRIGR